MHKGELGLFEILAIHDKTFSETLRFHLCVMNLYLSYVASQSTGLGSIAKVPISSIIRTEKQVLRSG